MTCAPSPRATKYGVPPTDRNARTGEFTPPGMTRDARANSSSFVVMSQHLSEISGEVREDDVGAGALHGRDVLEGDGVTVDPPALGGRLHHRVLTRHVVRDERHVDDLAHIRDHVEVRQCRL